MSTYLQTPAFEVSHSRNTVVSHGNRLYPPTRGERFPAKSGAEWRRGRSTGNHVLNLMQEISGHNTKVFIILCLLRSVIYRQHIFSMMIIVLF